MSVSSFVKEIEESKPFDEKYLLVDVRPEVQFGIVNTNQSSKLSSTIKAINVQQKQLADMKEELQKKEKIFVMCRRGNQSKEVT